MNCQGWSRQGQVCQGGFRLFAGAGRTGAAGDTAAGTLDSWLACPRIVAGDNNPTSWRGKGKIQKPKRIVEVDSDLSMKDILCVCGIEVSRQWQPFVLTSWAAAGDQLASEELGAHSEGQAGQSRYT